MGLQMKLIPLLATYSTQTTLLLNIKHQDVMGKLQTYEDKAQMGIFKINLSKVKILTGETLNPPVNRYKAITTHILALNA